MDTGYGKWQASHCGMLHTSAEQTLCRPSTLSCFKIMSVFRVWDEPSKNSLNFYDEFENGPFHTQSNAEF
jgi:hypothetical protein